MHILNVQHKNNTEMEKNEIKLNQIKTKINTLFFIINSVEDFVSFFQSSDVELNYIIVIWETFKNAQVQHAHSFYDCKVR